MSKETILKKQQLHELLLRIPTSGSFESVSLTRRVSQLAKDLQKEERLEREAKSGGRSKPDAD